MSTAYRQYAHRLAVEYAIQSLNEAIEAFERSRQYADDRDDEVEAGKWALGLRKESRLAAGFFDVDVPDVEVASGWLFGIEPTATTPWPEGRMD
jgi:hypothetical protein